MQPIIDMISKALNTVGVKVDLSLLEGLNFPDLMGKITDPKAFQNEIASQLMSKVGINGDMASKVGSMMDVSKLGDLAGMAGNMGDMGKMATGAVAAAGAGGIFGAVTDMVSNLFGHHEEAAQEEVSEQASVEPMVETMSDEMGDMMQTGQTEQVEVVDESQAQMEEVVAEPEPEEVFETAVEEVMPEESETGEEATEEVV
jgi:hypothetical protein